MFKVGLTGGIASGKSTVSAIFTEKGIEVIDADIIAREVLVLYPEISKAIKNTFGEHFFTAEGSLNRKALGEYIFKYPGERKKLDDIMIPPIKEEIFKRLKAKETEGVKVCVLDAPTLIEHGIHENMDLNILVWVDKDLQVERLKIRDNLTTQQALNRINAQMSLDEKKKYVNFIIDNSKDLDYLKEQVKEVIEVLSIYLN
ncbi:dephospho-CoA kinase [Clostridium thermarum]|uniref:dephospho-CoA kinase n=1 Tax=Clostridium thermarum TaxID=1716543 RepID=UPI0011232E5E|nr:dephospho-CoA kinase [Clostridium thermarum]